MPFQCDNILKSTKQVERILLQTALREHKRGNLCVVLLYDDARRCNRQV